jgi:general secretion pathway protein A
VGTGKTTLIRTFMERIGTSSTHVAFIFDSTMPYDGLVEYMLEDFGIPSAGKTRAQRLFALNRFLIERRRAGQTAAVVVDEAQNLSLANLEHLRLLSNFETPTGKLLQIILVGQPELRDKLARPELRQLRQRLGMRCAIRPLTPEETRSYVRSRLHVAGASDTRLFADAAIERIAAYTSGIPRLVNIVCDHCLLIGYAEQTRRVEREMVERAIEYLEDGQRPAHARGMFWRPAARRLRWLVSGFGAAAIAAVALMAAAVGAVSASGSIAGQFLDYARLARDLVMR